jgi:hypothetical protein
VSWILPNTNGDAVSKYLIEMKQQNSNSWGSDLTNCDGTKSSIVQSTQCVIPMSVFTSNYGYSFDQLVIFRVSGSNSIGFGPSSLPNTVGARVRSVPMSMNPPTRGSGSTDN